jgi:putative membrane protein
MNRPVLAILTGLALTVIAGCAPAPDPASAPGSSTSSGASITDGQIAGIVVAANTIDVDAGRLALTKSQDPEVRRFAELMVTDHTAVNAAAIALVQRLGVTPAESAVGTDLKSSAAQTHTRLSALQGGAFDRAYLDHEIAYHEAVIGALDAVLIPGAQNADLRAALVAARPAFQSHLDHARGARGALDSGGGR